MPIIPSITGLMLAGGRGQRMGGIDKGLIQLKGKTLAARTLSRLAQQTAAQFISANRSNDGYQALGVKVLADRRPDYPGPLAGIEAGLHDSTTDLVLVVPCDAPLLPIDLAERLLLAMQAHQAEIALASDGERPQFLHALITRRLLPDLSRYLDDDGHAVYRWYQLHKVIEVDFSDCRDAFVNINTPEELEALGHKLK